MGGREERLRWRGGRMEGLLGEWIEETETQSMSEEGGDRRKWG